MEKELVPYEIALELKNIGFEELCFAYYCEDVGYGLKYVRPQFLEDFNKRSGTYYNDISAPLKQQVFRWFREKYDLDCYIESKYLTTGERCYDYTILIDDGEETDDGKRWRTFKEAELKCLTGLIDIVKKK
jgi:hypothetical protein